MLKSNLFASCLLACRKACWSPETLCHAAEWAAVFTGRSAREQRSTRPAETQDHVPPVAGGALQTQQHQRPEARLQRVLPQPHPAPELPGFSMHPHADCGLFVSCSSLFGINYLYDPNQGLSGLICYIFFRAAVHRTWTSPVSVKSWRNMTRSWTLLAGQTGAWLMWRWRHSTPARRSHSSSPRQRCPLEYTQIHNMIQRWPDA